MLTPQGYCLNTCNKSLNSQICIFKTGDKSPKSMCRWQVSNNWKTIGSYYVLSQMSRYFYCRGSIITKAWYIWHLSLDTSFANLSCRVMSYMHHYTMWFILKYDKCLNVFYQNETKWKGKTMTRMKWFCFGVSLFFLVTIEDSSARAPGWYLLWV